MYWRAGILGSDGRAQRCWAGARAPLCAEAAAIFKLYLKQSAAGGRPALRVASSLEELDAFRGGDEGARLRKRAGAGCDAGGLAGCGCASWHRSEHALAYTYAWALGHFGPTLAAVGGVSFSAAGTGTCQSSARMRGRPPGSRSTAGVPPTGLFHIHSVITSALRTGKRPRLVHTYASGGPSTPGGVFFARAAGPRALDAPALAPLTLASSLRMGPASAGAVW